MRLERIGILGAGALGSLFAYYLTSRTSLEVRLLTRTGIPGEVTVEGVGRTAVQVSTRPNQPVDLLLVLVKSYATADALHWASGAVGPQTLVLTLQNGLGNGEALAESVGPERTLAGVTAQGATLLSAGVVRHGGRGPTRIAPWTTGGPADWQAEAVAELLAQAEFPTEVCSDPQPLLWSKLAVNCGINALTGVLRVPNGELLSRPGARRLMEAASREAGEVAAAAGIALEGDPVEETLAVARATGANRSSMLQDLEHGRRTEVEAINGAVAARGRALGVQTPVNETLTDLVRALERSEV